MMPRFLVVLLMLACLPAIGCRRGPAPTYPVTGVVKTVDGKPEERLMAEKAFARGHDRAMVMIRKESEEFARSLDFTGFLATLGSDDG